MDEILIKAEGVSKNFCRECKLHALTLNGREEWSFLTGAWVDSSPAVGTDGTIYFGSWDTNFYALNPNGSLKWRFPTGGIIDSSPAIGRDGTLYFGSHDKKYYALAPDGTKKWAFATGDPIISSPAIAADGAIYFTSVDGLLYAQNSDGSLRWRLHTGGVTASSPVIDPDGTIYVGVNNFLWAVASDGKKKWAYHPTDYAQQPMETALTLTADGSMDVISFFGRLVALDSKGRPKWSINLDHNPPAIPAFIAVDGFLIAKYNGLNAFAVPASLVQMPWPKFRGNPRSTGNIHDTAD